MDGLSLSVVIKLITTRLLCIFRGRANGFSSEFVTNSFFFGRFHSTMRQSSLIKNSETFFCCCCCCSLFRFGPLRSRPACKKGRCDSLVDGISRSRFFKVARSLAVVPLPFCDREESTSALEPLVGNHIARREREREFHSSICIEKYADGSVTNVYLYSAEPSHKYTTIKGKSRFLVAASARYMCAEVEGGYEKGGREQLDTSFEYSSSFFFSARLRDPLLITFLLAANAGDFSGCCIL